jgi:hypothetical protein
MPAYQEGDWFAVPLREGGFAVGVIARANPRGALLGYFFGPHHREIPDLEEAANLRPEDAVLVGKFGHLGLTQGKWPILGQLNPWDRTKWPMPVFVRYEELTGRTFLVFYDADDPATVLAERQTESVAAEQNPKDGLMGAGYVEIVLTKRLQ